MNVYVDDNVVDVNDENNSNENIEQSSGSLTSLIHSCTNHKEMNLNDQVNFEYDINDINIDILEADEELCNLSFSKLINSCNQSENDIGNTSNGSRETFSQINDDEFYNISENRKPINILQINMGINMGETFVQ